MANGKWAEASRSTDELSSLARALYRYENPITRSIQSLRPYICPFEILIDLVPLGSSVLDIGCGPGLFLGLLACEGRIARGHGLDLSMTALAHAAGMRKGLSSAKKSILSFEYCDLTQFQPKIPFDVVSLIDVLHHVIPRSQEAAISRSADSISSGGLLLYKDISPLPQWRAWANTLHDLVMSRSLAHYVCMAEMVRWTADKGLRLIEERRINRLWYTHVIAVFKKS
ncbi:MAG: class I SAM-dependent methyltransferase [Thermodesulfobacteriota bacterium]|nr:class I SAM-dependent methyltransferase [Thermodesulfobacteriota bacterium]